jgi:hypothetical protein
MDQSTFLRHAIQDARSLLNYTDGDVSRAVQVALQGAHAQLPQEQFFMAMDALGGHEAVVTAMTQELTKPFTMDEVYDMLGWGPELPTRADIEAQITFEREHGATPPQ